MHVAQELPESQGVQVLPIRTVPLGQTDSQTPAEPLMYRYDDEGHDVHDVVWPEHVAHDEAHVVQVRPSTETVPTGHEPSQVALYSK